MKQYLKDLFSEGSVASVTRFGFAALIISACGCSWYATIFRTDNTGIISALLTAAVTLKVGQKYLETK